MRNAPPKNPTAAYFPAFIFPVCSCCAPGMNPPLFTTPYPPVSAHTKIAARSTDLHLYKIWKSKSRKSISCSYSSLQPILTSGILSTYLPLLLSWLSPVRHIPHNILQTALKYSAQSVKRSRIHRFVLSKFVDCRTGYFISGDQRVRGLFRLLQCIPERPIINQFIHPFPAPHPAKICISYSLYSYKRFVLYASKANFFCNTSEDIVSFTTILVDIK